ncbi:MAG: exodeoxyribonuclease VII small subunit [Alphaproteobacteria bacterium]|nr:exodeoxyribonuclease VII small subunit [Alphaproteobacteria bacterium]
MTTKDTKTVTFEEDMTALQNLVEQLEQGDISLEQSLKSFEEGTVLLKRCRAKLAETETKVQNIMDAVETNGTIEENAE